MKDDTQRILEEMEQELLREEPESKPEGEPDILEDTLVRSVLADAQPAFEDPDAIHEPKEPLVYCNYSNDYGRDLKDFAETGGKTQDKKEDKILTWLMFAASGLCLGIVGLLIYWLTILL